MNRMINMRKPFLFLFLTLVCLFMLAGQVLAQDPEPNYDRINEVAKDLNCPTCTGINLADCRTLTCEQWRDKIGELITEGYSDQEVLDYFSTRYGTQVLLEPPRTGFTMALWILPVIALLAGGGWLFYTIRGWRNQAGEVSGNSSPAVNPTRPDVTDTQSDNYLSQVEKDLGLE